MEMEDYCQLIPVGGVHSLIELEDMKPLIIGRNSLTAIMDKKCSRKQMEVCADFTNKEVKIKHLGFHPSQVATKVLQRGDTFLLGPMGWFEVLEGNFKYHVHFGKRMSESEMKRNQQVSEFISDKKLDYEDEPPKKKFKTTGDSNSIQKTLISYVEKDSASSCSDLTMKPTWRETDSMLILQYGPDTHSIKIAAFDLDNTIIETQSGKKFATGPTDWKLMSGVQNKLNSLSNDGYKVVFFTNQLGISKGKHTKAEFKQKIEEVSKKLEIPLLLMAATTKDIYRKPCTGMWDHLVNFENGKEEVDIRSSFYVGDAAGREDKWLPGKKKDFSCADRKFAANIGLNFFTPEEIFLDFPPCKKYNFGEFNPMKLDLSEQTQSFINPSCVQEMILFVGYPASGKTSFFKKHLEPNSYCHVNRDILGSWQKCVSKCKEYLEAGKSVAVDNTNPDVESRSRYIEVAKKFGKPVRCFQFMTSIHHAKHNNRFRELTKNDNTAKVNDMVFNIYKSKFKEPSCDEGFSEIVKIEFCPYFTDESSKTLYCQFLD